MIFQPFSSFRKTNVKFPWRFSPDISKCQSPKTKAAVADNILAKVPEDANVAVLPWNLSQPELAGFIAMKLGGTRFISAFKIGRAHV
mgnify:CR=1 FL=1